MRMINFQIDRDKLLRRTGVFDAYRFIQTHPHKDSSMEQEEECDYLVSTNPRLIELKEKYSRLTVDIFRGSQWTPAYVNREVSLTDFRSDTAFMWQFRDYNFAPAYLSTYYYLKSGARRDLLERCSEDNLFGIYTVSTGGECVSRDRLDSASELAFLRSALGCRSYSRVTFLDIGSGYGRFAYRVSQCFPKMRVICVDVIPESSFICEFYLRFRKVGSAAKIVEFQNLNTALNDTRIDMAVAVNSLSECSPEALTWWLELLGRLRIKYLFLVPHAAHEGGQKILNWDTQRKCFVDVLALCRTFGYKVIACAPKYDDQSIQKFGVSPTYYHLLEL